MVENDGKVTGNAALLLGYLAAGVRTDYSMIDITPATCSMILERKDTGNQFRIVVEQISGVE